MDIRFEKISALVKMGGIAAMANVVLAAPALARDPKPPPSGIVIHLFGQDSIMSNVLPTAPGVPGGVPATNAAAISGGAGEAPQGPSIYSEPTTGEILHQMFVTGDPNDPSRPAPGRVADRPAQ